MASPADESTDWLKGMLTIAVLLGLGTLIGILMLYGQQRPQASIADCRASNMRHSPRQTASYAKLGRTITWWLATTGTC